ncbi:MAG: FAD-binding oxidoreductase [Bdellovibrionota bacterium]
MMKWWGWGNPNFTFPMENKPNLWPFIRSKVGLQSDDKTAEPVAREKVKLAPPNIDEQFMLNLAKVLRPEQFSTDDDQRLLHSYGKSYADLFYVRKGIVKKAPDIIIFPQSHEDVEVIIKIANDHDVCVVPFGGGTNIVGGVDPRDSKNSKNNSRMIVTLSMQRMNNLISIDAESRIATIQAGALGPKLEKDLQEKGWSLGHYPDSFEYSTLGGWIATRSAGMQSDAYGKIEDMVVSLKMVTPTGTIVTKTTPASSAGPDFNRVIAGSEGILGVITEATMRVHKSPVVKDYRGFLFPSFAKGVAAICECLDKGYAPSLIRLQDEAETQLAFNLKSPKKGIEAVIQKQVKNFLKLTGYKTPCIMIVGFEGETKPTEFLAQEAVKILKKHRAFPLGSGVGKTWSEDKFNVPYLRDFVMDYGVMVDVAETAATWSNILNVHTKTLECVQNKFAQEAGGAGYIGCHISHTYQTGACLYFTYAAKQVKNKEMEQYYEYKKLVTENFMNNGATLTHHHAVGYEHSPWLEREITATGVKTLKALKNSLDPKNILNPGKLIPEEDELNHGLFGIDAPDVLAKSARIKPKRKASSSTNHKDAQENNI